MIPSIAQLTDAQYAIESQHPSLSLAPLGDDGCLELRLTPVQASTITLALGITHGVAKLPTAPEPPSGTPVQKGWAAIIDGGLMARGSAGLASEALAALERVDPATLERMAALVLGDRAELGPDTPETAAAKARAARSAFDAFRDGVHPTGTFMPDVTPAGEVRR